LKGKLVDLCFACHDDFLEKAKFRHAPAESGECTLCHNPHESKEKALLVKPGSPLCFECHEAADVAKVKAHGPIGDSACTACHDPHQGERRFFLKPSADKPLDQQAGARGK
jgi:predicted CXXCH cytochrome family protein